MRDLRILNLGAGVQSTTVYLLALDGHIPPFDYAIFADTQEEPVAVYRHLDWLKGIGGPPIVTGTAGKLGDDLLQASKRWVSIPAYTAGVAGQRGGLLQRQCSKEYKVAVIERVIRRQLLGLRPRQRWPKDRIVVQSFGISSDEAGRAVRISRTFGERRRGQADFPLLALNWTRAHCAAYLRDRVPHEVPRSACVFCPYHTDTEWLRLKRQDPDGWARAIAVDEGLRIARNTTWRHVKRAIYLHSSCRPLAKVDLNEQQREFPTFALECEGVCGV